MKWSLQVVFETDLPRGAANVFSVYMSVHAIVSDCVSVPLSTGLFFELCALYNESKPAWHYPQSLSKSHHRECILAVCACVCVCGAFYGEELMHQVWH